MSDADLERLKRRSARERAARKQAEMLLEAKSLELFESNQALARLNETLEHRVKVRTEELLKARDTALAATRAKSDFLAVMSHEIRTPMNGVLGTLDLLEDSALGIEQRELVKIAQDSGQLLLAVINDILDMSKLEAGTVELEEIPFSMRDMLDDIVAAPYPGQLSRDVELFMDVDGNVPQTLLGDPIRIRQIFTNLLSNATKFTAKGEIIVRVTFQGGKTVCQVKDTGIGISEAQRSRLFKPFTQADSSTTRKYGGTGLGLTICKALVDAMDGSIALESEFGVGTTFTVTLPLGFSHEPGIVGERNVFCGGRVLVASASSTFTRFTCKLLRSWGFVAHSAATTQQTLQMLATSNRKPYKLALVSSDLRDSRGSTLEQIRALPDLGTLPLVAIRPYGSAARIPFANLTLAKPVARRQLYRGLQQVLGSQSPPPSTRRTEASQEISARVLLAEDDATNRQVALAMFKSLGITPDLALNGQEAVDAATRQQYDVIFMDGQMPVVDGFAATSLIRAAESKAGRTPVPIVAFTASALDTDRERFVEAGMDDFLSKPVTRQALGEKLFKFVDDRRKSSGEPDSPRPAGNNTLSWSREA